MSELLKAAEAAAANAFTKVTDISLNLIESEALLVLLQTVYMDGYVDGWNNVQGVRESA